MGFSRSFCLASALVLSFTTTARSAVAVIRRDYADPESWRRLDKRQATERCVDDDYYTVLKSNVDKGEAQTFCNKWLGIAPATTATDVTPTITITASDSYFTTGSTQTERITTTQTVTSTATSTILPLARRAANIAHQQQLSTFVNDVNRGAIAAPTASSTLNGKAELDIGFTSVCNCLKVDPTATVTNNITVTPVRRTLHPWNVITTTETTTIVQTVQRTVLVTPNQTAPASLSISPLSNQTVTLPTSENVLSNTPSTNVIGTITPTIPASILSSGVGSLSQPVVTGLPIACPKNNGDRITNIIGNHRDEYAVYCDTAIANPQSLLSVVTTGPTECAAQCSFINDRFEKAYCQSVTYNPRADGGGDCLITGPLSVTKPSPGSVTFVLTGQYSAGENCSSVDFNHGSTNGSAQESSLLSAIAKSSVSLEIPGFITSGGGGGQFHTRYTSFSTDTRGVIYYTWHQIDASSSDWYAVYATSWSCSNILTPKFVDQGSTPVTVPTPTGVVALTTVGGGVFSTGGSTLIASTQAGGGNLSPSATPTPTALPTFQLSVNSTLASLGGSGLSGSLAFTTSGAFSTSNETGGNGIISPSGSTQSSSNAVLNTTSKVFATGGAFTETLSSAVLINNSTGGGGLLSPTVTPPLPTSGGAVGTISGGTETTNSTAGYGVESPVPSGVFNVTISTSTLLVNETGGGGSIGPTGSISTIPGTAGSINISISGSTSTVNETGGRSVLSPLSGSATTISSPPVSGRISVVISGNTFTLNSTEGGGVVSPSPTASSNKTVSNSATSGGLSFVTSGNTSFIFSTGGQGIISPTSGGSNGIPTPANATSGSFIATLTGGSSIANSTGGGGVISPSSSIPTNRTIATRTLPVLTSGAQTTLALPGGSSGILPSANSSVGVPGPLTSGVGNFTTSRSEGITLSTGGNFVLSPSGSATLKANSTTSGVPGTGPSTRSNNEAVPSASVPTGSANLTTFGATAVASSSAGNGELSPSASPSRGLNITSILSTRAPLSTGVSGVPTQSTNSTIGSSLTLSGAKNFTISSGTAVILSTAGFGIITPSVNSTLTASETLKPSNTTTPESLITPSGGANFTTSGGTAAILSTAGAGVITPSLNSSLATPASLTPTPSLNTSSIFSEDTGLRSGRLRSTIRPNSTIVGTAPIGTSPAVLPSKAPSSESIPAPGGYGPPRSSSIPAANLTAPFGTGTQPLPEVSAPSNSSALSGTAPLSTGVPAFPTTSSELNSTFPSGTGLLPTGILVLNSTTAASSASPPSSSNVTSIQPTRQPSLTIPPLASNSTTSIPPSSNDTDIMDVSFSDAGRRGSLTRTTSLPSASGPAVPSTNLTSSLVTGSSFIPTPSANSSKIIPAPSVNSTGPLGTGTATIPIALVNSSAPIGSVTNALPTQPENVTLPIVTVPASSLIPTASVNLTLPVATASVGIPVSANRTVPLVTAPLGTGPSSVLAPTANSSIPTGTGLSFVPAPSANSTLPLGTGTAISPSGNIPSLSANETCPPPTPSVEYITRTLITVEAITHAPTRSCAPTNGTLAFPTASAQFFPRDTGAPPQPGYSSPTVSSSVVSRRQSSQLATRQQIDDACAKTSNRILNADFEAGSKDNDSSGWSWKGSDRINFQILSVDTSQQHTPSGKYVGRIVSKDSGAEITITQPLTLCPGKTYNVGGWMETPDKLAECQVTVRLGDKVIYTTQPTEQWTQKSQTFTVGQDDKDASVDFKLEGVCNGQLGQMVVDIDDMKVERA